MINQSTISTPIKPLKQKRIFIYWLPLAISWLMMGSEMPFIYSILARLNQSQIMIAAFGIVAPLSIMIESPVISLLSTGTALSKSRQNYAMLRKFVIHLMILTFAIHGLISFTPLISILLTNIMNVPHQFHAHIISGMKIMILWSPLIGWRRFLQGIMIRFGRTKFIGYGTIVRLFASAGTAAYLGLSLKLPGIIVATYALEIGVLIEVIFAHLIVQPTLREKFGPESSLSAPDITYNEIMKFHAPLAASTFLFLLTLPAISTALGMGNNPELYLAAWPILFGLFFLIRTPTQALPEVTIALFEEQTKNELKNFALKVGVFLTTLLLIMSYTPLGNFYFEKLIGVESHLTELILPVMKFGILIPLFMGLVNYQRGKFSAIKKTIYVTYGLISELITLVLVLAIGINLQLPGTLIATIAVTFSIFVDLIVLSIGERKLK